MQTSEKFSQPAEWALHDSCFLAWPSHAELWQENLPAAQNEFTKLCEAIVDLDPATGIARGESLEILVKDELSFAQAKAALAKLPVRFHQIPFGDIWLRDTAPIFLTNKDGLVACAKFNFNGWGGKYDLPFDAEVSTRIAEASEVPVFSHSFILEGGSIEVDGEGTCLTSKQCLLNPNRNPDLNQKEVEAKLMQSLGVEKVLWLGDGLLNDHTDGHIDTIARYVAPATIACMQTTDQTDPNYEVLETIARDLETFTDAKGRKIKVVRVPSPGIVLSDAGEAMPASFYIANSTVVVPTYGVENDQAAVAAIAKIFPTRKTIGSPAYAILSGGGAFHCITQQRPSGVKHHE
jgi:agmatine deiminase